MEKIESVNQLSAVLGFEEVVIPEKFHKIDGCYAGDLLSWVMGRAKPDNIWVTIMTNINVIAVASLLDLACVVICENSEISEEIVSTAKEKGVNILRSPLPVYETCVKISQVI